MSRETAELAMEIRRNLWRTRQEPGLSLRQIANCIRKELKVEEIDALIRDLKHGQYTELREKSSNGTAENSTEGKTEPSDSNS